MRLLLLVTTLLALASSVRPFHGRQGMLSLTPVHGRIVVEPTLPTPFPEEITLVFADAQGRAVADITLSESIRTTNFRSTRGGVSGEVRILADGTFNLMLPRGEHRLILRRRPNPRTGQSSSLAEFYVKSVQAGSTNLLEKPLVVKASFDGEIVIALAQCTSETQEVCK